MKSIGEGLGSLYDEWIAGRIDAYDQGMLTQDQITTLRNWDDGVDLLSNLSRVIHNRASQDQTLAWLRETVAKAVDNPIDDDDLRCNRAALSNYVARLNDKSLAG